MQSLLSGYQSPRVAVPYGQGHATVAPRNLMVIGGKGARAVRLRGKDGLVRDMMMYKVYEEAHGRSIRRLFVKAVQEEGSGGKEGTVPTKGTRTVKEEAESGRKIVFAVDGTVAAEEGLRWFARQIVRKGDVVHLAHVICDPRTPATAVGSSTAATQWSLAGDEQRYQNEFMSRIEKEARDMLNARFIPTLEFSGIKYETDLLRLKVHKSAGGIAESLSNCALNLGADLLVIASHGAGVLADYGSVARWCSENSPIPTLLLPPEVLSSSLNQQTLANSVMVAAAEDLKGLRTAFDYAVTDMTGPGDTVYVIHTVNTSDENELAALRKQLVGMVSRWQDESPIPHAPTLNVAVQVVTAQASDSEQLTVASITQDEELEPDFSPAGCELCDLAQQINARSVVLAHHGRNVMREMVYKPVTLHCMRHCPRPLVVLKAPMEAHSIGY